MMTTMASLASNMDILAGLPVLKYKPSNIEKLTDLVCKSMQRGAALNKTHDHMYKLTEAISDHKFKYESAIATALTTLINNVAMHPVQPVVAKRLVGAPKVIKSHLKPKVVKATEPPRHIYQGHIKALLEVVARNGQHATMTAAGVPAALILQTVGARVDPVVGAGASSEAIWGAVV